MSIFIILIKSSSFRIFFAYSLIFLLNNSIFFIGIVNPAAPASPPNLTNYSGMLCKAFKILKPSILLHEPTAIPSSSLTSIIMTGL